MHVCMLHSYLSYSPDLLSPCLSISINILPAYIIHSHLIWTHPCVMTRVVYFKTDILFMLHYTKGSHCWSDLTASSFLHMKRIDETNMVCSVFAHHLLLGEARRERMMYVFTWSCWVGCFGGLVDNVICVVFY